MTKKVKEWNCEICQKSFSSKWKLRAHIDKEHKITNKPGKRRSDDTVELINGKKRKLQPQQKEGVVKRLAMTRRVQNKNLMKAKKSHLKNTKKRKLLEDDDDGEATKRMKLDLKRKNIRSGPKIVKFSKWK